ncbi:hypothetical protein DXG03_001192 [Asterophora parasitica]|uniref:Uncharacterized protein n=1 Tax=Asterophora parasitica TaxID=117018 RepID=A0A9P7G723_9AGAR|nr:hypothetical protein DXG03_001192 [Asterophora parasitica]
MAYATDPNHDEINLRRLVRRLEKTSADWEESPRGRAWIKAQGALQKVKFARKLLKNVEIYEEDQSPTRIQQLNDIRIRLDKVETHTKDIYQRTSPTPTRPPPILPSIPQPPPPAVSTVHELSLDGTDSAAEREPGATPPHTDDLLLPADTPHLSSTSFSFPAPMALIPTTTTTATATAVTTGAAPRFLHNSSALQQELSDQLAQMATQLKRNAVHFADTLSRDQAVVEETQQKIESNFDVMQKERVRLRDHRGKSGSTTCLVVLIVIAVVLLFMLMVSIIRFT